MPVWSTRRARWGIRLCRPRKPDAAPVEYGLISLRCGNMTNRGLRAWLDAGWPAIADRLPRANA